MFFVVFDFLWQAKEALLRISMNFGGLLTL